MEEADGHERLSLKTQCTLQTLDLNIRHTHSHARYAPALHMTYEETAKDLIVFLNSVGHLHQALCLEDKYI